MRKPLRYVALAVVVSLAGTQLASADRPAFNPACEGTKIEPVVSGTYAVPFGTGAGSITLVVTDTPAGEVFDFVTDSATHLVSSVVAKGGTDYMMWEFNPAVSSASGLHASLNPESGKWYGLSHLCFTTVAGGGGGGEE